MGLDRLSSPFTTVVGSIRDEGLLRRCLDGVDAVLHTATLHKPHVATHSRGDFVDVNVAGTLTLLEAAVKASVGCFVFTSTTSTFGRALVPPAYEPAAWITEEVTPVPKNIYGVTKTAAEDLCELIHRDHGLPCVVLRTSRFFPEEDDNPDMRRLFAGDNMKANEYLYRRVDISDAVAAHLLAIERPAVIGFSRYIISSATPFEPRHLTALRLGAAGVVGELFPEYEAVYDRLGWRMFPSIERVYVSHKARDELGFQPVYDFAHVLERMNAGASLMSDLARAVGSKGYHRSDP